MADASTTTDPVFIVSSAMDVLQVFASETDAQRYAAQLSGARVSRRLMRTSLDEAVVIVDRRVVLRNGEKRVDEKTKVRQFFDDPSYLPEPADVEWFQGDDGQDWHIAGFGTDERRLDAMIEAAVAEVCRLSLAAKANRLNLEVSNGFL